METNEPFSTSLIASKSSLTLSALARLGWFCRRNGLDSVAREGSQGKNVSFVLMIGITESDMKYFNDSFGIIIDKFSSKESTNALLKSGSFEEFSEILLSRN